MTIGPDFSNPSQTTTRTVVDYDADNMPVQIQHSANGSTVFIYDGEGKRAKKIEKGVV